MNVSETTVGLFITAESVETAFALAYERWHGDLYRHYKNLKNKATMEPLHLEEDHPYGRRAVDDLWAFQEKQTKTAIIALAAELALDDGLMESLIFRSLARHIGTLTGWPVRLYDTEGVGIIFASVVLGMVRGMPDAVTGVPVLDLSALTVLPALSTAAAPFKTKPFVPSRAESSMTPLLPTPTPPNTT